MVVSGQPRGDVADLEAGGRRALEGAVRGDVQEEGGIEVGDDVVAGRAERVEGGSPGERGATGGRAEFGRVRRDRVVASHGGVVEL